MTGTGDRFTPEQKERALQELVLADYNIAAAHGRLKAAGINVARRSLLNWRNDEGARLEQLEDTREQWTLMRMTEDSESAAAISHQALARVLDHALNIDLDKLTAGQTAALMTALAKTRASAVDKAAAGRGRPQQITQSREVGELLRALDAKFPGIVSVNPALSVEAEDVKEITDGD